MSNIIDSGSIVDGSQLNNPHSTQRSDQSKGPKVVKTEFFSGDEDNFEGGQSELAFLNQNLEQLDSPNYNY